MLTECRLVTRTETEYSGKRTVGSCALYEHMKSNTLADILRVLKRHAGSRSN